MSMCSSVYGTGVESHKELVFGATGVKRGADTQHTHMEAHRETHAHRHFKKGFYF